MTYKAYVEDEEDERSEKLSTDTEASDDELSDSDESSVPISKEYIMASDKESFMDDLAALLVSEEFRGIVATETTNNTKSVDAETNTSASEPKDSNVGPTQPISATDSGSSQGTFLRATAAQLILFSESI